MIRPTRWTPVYLASALIGLGAGMVVYMLIRGTLATFGFSLRDVVIAAMATIMMSMMLASGPLFVLTIILAIVDTIYAERPRQRWDAGLCPRCKYPRRVLDAQTCSECGAPLIQPETRMLLPFFGHAALTLIIGLVLGMVAGEARMQIDEAMFRAEVNRQRAAGTHTFVRRERCWPNGNCALLYAPERGFWAND